MNILDAAVAFRAYGLTFPEATEDFPWGETVLKVKGKVFVFLGRPEGMESEWGMSLKLPISKEEALAMPGASPTGYGLGKAGWVSLRFRPGDEVPMEQLERWLEESYRSVAPKRVAARLAARG
jgi:predicted DNA-binding protein (MmcQ/YjbR family)